MSDGPLPVLLIAENNRKSLQEFKENLENRYGGQYQVAAFATGREALEALKRFGPGSPVALFIVGCELDGRSGVEWIARAREQFPSAKRVLLADYNEKENLVASLKRQELDSYLLQPLNSPEDELYPVIDDLLQDWQNSANPSGAGIRLVGYRWSAPAHQLKNFLARNLVPYTWLELEESEEARELIEAARLDGRRLPVVFFPDGSYMTQPDIDELAGRVGLQHQAQSQFYDFVVVGGGPAGLSAAVYGASEGLDTLLIEAEAPGGQAGQSSRIENYLGFPSGLSGNELTRRAVAQAARFGVEIITPAEATGIELRGIYRLVHLADGSRVACYAVLIATGVSYLRLNVPGEDRLTGAGVFYGTVITEAVSCTGKEVFILGGGNSAGQAAMYLARFARSITILTIEDSLQRSMSQYLIHQIGATENIQVRVKSTITELHGERHLEAVTVRDIATGKSEVVPAAALFIYIGAHPRTDWLGDLLARDEQGYILTGNDVRQAGANARFQALGRDPYFLESSVPGIFAAGDTRHGSVKRIASGVGEGAMAVALIHQYMASL